MILLLTATVRVSLRPRKQLDYMLSPGGEPQMVAMLTTIVWKAQP